MEWTPSSKERGYRAHLTTTKHAAPHVLFKHNPNKVNTWKTVRPFGCAFKTTTSAFLQWGDQIVGEQEGMREWGEGGAVMMMMVAVVGVS